MCNEKKRRLISDLDGSFIRWSLFLFLIEKLLELFPDLLPKETLARIRSEHLSWVERAHPRGYQNYLDAWVKDVDNGLLKGVSVAEVTHLASRLIKKHKNKLYVFSRELLLALVEASYDTTAISLSPDFLVCEAARIWGFDHGIGTTYEVANGVFTGVRTLPDKRRIVTEMLDDPRFERHGSVAIGDTGGDLSMILLATHGIAFNPNRDLEQEARRHRIPVVWERKDVIAVFRPDERGRLHEADLYDILPPDVACILERRLKRWREKR